MNCRFKIENMGDTKNQSFQLIEISDDSSSGDDIKIIKEISNSKQSEREVSPPLARQFNDEPTPCSSSSCNDSGYSWSELNIKRIKKDSRSRPGVISSDDEDDDDEKNIVSSFDSNPHYIKNGTMRDYQLRGLNWLISIFDKRSNAILADEMGLGKTLQTISLLGYLKHYRNISGPHLIIVPKSTLQNWVNEFNKWCPSMRVITIMGEKTQRQHFIRKVFYKGLTKWDVTITTYEMVLKEKYPLTRFTNWVYIIIDEGHRIKNENTKLAEYARTFNTTNRLLLTGTPLQNNLHELWALLNFILPETFNSSEDFDSWFENQGQGQNDNGTGNKAASNLHSILKPYLLRRLKADVENIPPKREIKVYCRLSEMQREWYVNILMKNVEILTENKKASKKLKNVLMHLRKACNHPYLFEGAEPEPYTNGQHLVDNSGKMIILDKLLPKLKEEGSRILIFSQFKMTLNILEDYCFLKKYNYCRLDGDTDHDLRSSQIDEYNKPGSEKFIFLISTRAGGLGINLATADVVVIFDSDWNPQMDLQAMDRCHRIGQTKEVRVFRLISENTVEEKIIERAEAKLRLDWIVIQQGRLSEEAKINPSSDDLVNIIRFGADKILAAKMKEECSIKDDNIENILAKSKIKSTELTEKLAAMGEGTLKKFSSEEIAPLVDPLKGIRLDIYSFEGSHYRPELKNKTQIALENILTSKRKKNVPNFLLQDLQDQEMTPLKKKLYNPKRPNSFQFPHPLLYEVYYRELDYFRQSSGFRLAKIRGIPLELIEMEIARYNKVSTLSRDEINDKIQLKKELQTTWNFGDFIEFIQASELVGPDTVPDVSYFKNRSQEEIVAYSQVFWTRAFEIESLIDYIKEKPDVKKKIETRIFELKIFLDMKIEQFKSRKLKEIKVLYDPPSWRGKRFLKKHDHWILLELHKIGLTYPNVFKILCNNIRKSDQYDSFLRTRDEIELQQRSCLLLQLIEKEMLGDLVNSEVNSNEGSVDVDSNSLSSDLNFANNSPSASSSTTENSTTFAVQNYTNGHGIFSPSVENSEINGHDDGGSIVIGQNSPYFNQNGAQNYFQTNEAEPTPNNANNKRISSSEAPISPILKLTKKARLIL